MKKMLKLSIVIPVHNEEKNVQVITTAIEKEMEILSTWDYEIIYVDDGSKDTTLTILEKMAKKNLHIKYISFSRNFGHQTALKAGLDHASGNIAISMDGDMQHPPELISTLIAKWKEGYEIVYTKRADKKFGFKYITAKIFYSILNRISHAKLEYGVADFRLLDRKVLDVIKKMPEKDIFFRGLIPWLGFSSLAIEYKPNERFAGTTSYTFKKMLKLALAGITAFSISPLRFAIKLGMLFLLFLFGYIVYVLIAFFTGNTISGWSSLVILIMLLGVSQILLLGVIGEYLGRIFLETKQRPTYIIRKSNLKI